MRQQPTATTGNTLEARLTRPSRTGDGRTATSAWSSWISRATWTPSSRGTTPRLGILWRACSKPGRPPRRRPARPPPSSPRQDLGRRTAAKATTSKAITTMAITSTAVTSTAVTSTGHAEAGIASAKTGTAGAGTRGTEETSAGTAGNSEVVSMITGGDTAGAGGMTAAANAASSTRTSSSTRTAARFAWCR